MTLPPLLQHLRLPVLCAPMFLVSGPDLVIAASRAGTVGSFPALNQRTTEGLDEWLQIISSALAAEPHAGKAAPALPYAVNLIVHKSNERLDQDVAVLERYRVPLIITSLGVRPELIERIHAWGGLVFHDVTTLRHAQKALESSVDGLILVCNGAGGHSGNLSAFAFVPEIRKIYSGPLILGGAISTGAGIAAARVMGADLVYMGTRCIATQESMADPDFKQMVLDGTAADTVYTASITGVHGNFLRASLRGAGLDPDNLPPAPKDFHTRRRDVDSAASGTKAWKQIWSAGQGIGAIDDLPSMAELTDRLEVEYRAALAATRTLMEQ